MNVNILFMRGDNGEKMTLIYEIQKAPIDMPEKSYDSNILHLYTLAWL